MKKLSFLLYFVLLALTAGLAAFSHEETLQRKLASTENTIKECVGQHNYLENSIQALKSLLSSHNSQPPRVIKRLQRDLKRNERELAKINKEIKKQRREHKNNVYALRHITSLKQDFKRLPSPQQAKLLDNDKELVSWTIQQYGTTVLSWPTMVRKERCTFFTAAGCNSCNNINKKMECYHKDLEKVYTIARSSGGTFTFDDNAITLLKTPHGNPVFIENQLFKVFAHQLRILLIEQN